MKDINFTKYRTTIPSMPNSNPETTKQPTMHHDYWSAFGVHLVDLMYLKPGRKLLDVGTGGGACLIPAARKIGETGKTIGIDSWEKILPEASENIENSGITNALVQYMKAQEMSFEDNTFDYATCGFVGFSDVYDFQKHEYKQENRKMEEMFRVLKNGGKAGFSTWGLQEEIEVLRQFVKKYLEVRNESTDKIKQIHQGYSRENSKGFEILLKDAGFHNLQIHSENYKIIYENEVEWWETMRQVAAIVLRQIGSELKDFQEFRETTMIEGLQQYKTERGYSFTKSVIFSFGMKPK